MREAGILLVKNLANLLKVKTILSLSVIFTTCILTFKNIISLHGGEIYERKVENLKRSIKFKSRRIR